MTKKIKKKSEKRFEIERLKELFSETLFVVSLGFMFVSVLFVAVVRSQELINLAEMLPADGMSAFWTYDVSDYTAGGFQAPIVFGQPVTDFDWFDGEFGTAVLDEEMVYFLDVSKRTQAKASIEEMLIEDESFTQNNDRLTTIYCFEYSHPNCFMFFGDVLITSNSESALQKVRETKSGAATVESLDEYQNAKGRLPLTSDAFGFVNLKETRQTAFQTLGNLGIFEPGYFESVLRIFPALAFTADMNDSNWEAEMFLAVGKEAIGNEAFYRSIDRYDGYLLDLSGEGFAFEWGGNDLSAQLQRISEILGQLNSAAALVFDSSLSTYFQKYFGTNVDENLIYKLLENEYYFAWTPDEKMLLMLNLEEGDAEIAEQLNEIFSSTFEVASEYEENGEVKAQLQLLEGFSSNYESQRYYHFSVGGQEQLFISIMDNLAVVSTSREEFFAALDRIKTRQNLRNTDSLGLSLWGVNEMFSIDMEFLPEGHILKTALKNFGKISQTRKLFDDGIYSKFQLELNPQQTDDNQSEYRGG